jgi:pyruvate,water dikinase
LRAYREGRRNGTILTMARRLDEHDDLADPLRVGAKASALAVARSRGLPVLDATVLPVDADPHSLHGAWRALSDDGARPLAVRSSSPVEDRAATSMAGHFLSVLDVRGWPATLDAIDRVRSSAAGHPMAVLLQPMCDAVLGGVLFGVDPVTGRADRIVVDAIDGGPDALVSGRRAASRHVLTLRGRLLEVSGEPRLRAGDCRRLATLAHDAAVLFGAPQDIEWAIDRDDRLWLLQSRPITAVAARPRGPRLGPGPVAETFPEPLAPLEVDLWVEPLRAAIAEALSLTGAASRPEIAGSPIVVDVGGRVAVDLDLVEGRPRSRIRALLDPRPAARRTAAAWRVGRLRRALPALARDLVAELDDDLGAVPPLATLDAPTLLGVIGRCRLALRAAHAHEILAGALTVADASSGVAAALRAVGAGRAAGLDDDAIVARWPVALALVPPSIGASPDLPPVAAAPAGDGPLGPRESLRLRVRWLHELSARAAARLGNHLAENELLPDPAVVRWLRLDELRAMIDRDARAPIDLFARVATDSPPPLPAAFRLTADGAVVAEPTTPRPGGGIGAGGGRGVGVVAAPGADAVGSVLVVRTLEPGLAAALPGRAGLVAETGSVLAHLAIVARELGVPTVVGVPDALTRFPPGTRVLVDGALGHVEVMP